MTVPAALHLLRAVFELRPKRKAVPAGRAFYHTGKPMTFCRARTAFRLAFALQTLDNAFPKRFCDDWFPTAFGKDCRRREIVPVCTSARRPAQIAAVDGIIQDITDSTAFKSVALMCAQSHFIQLPRKGGEGRASRILLEQPAYCLRFFRHNGKAFIFISVAEGGGGLPFTLFRLFLHSFMYFLRKIQGIIFCHCFQHAFINDGEFIVLRHRLLYGNHLYAVFFQQGFIKHSILSAAGKAVIFMHKDYLQTAVFLARKSYHTLESGAVFGFPPGDTFINKNPFLWDTVFVLTGKFFDFFQLRCRGIRCLFLCGNADICCGKIHAAALL